MGVTNARYDDEKEKEADDVQERWQGVQALCDLSIAREVPQSR